MTVGDRLQLLTAAKQRLHGLRPTREAQAEASAIQHQHGSRKSGLPPSGSKSGLAPSGPRSANRTRRTPAADEGQGQLF